MSTYYVRADAVGGGAGDTPDAAKAWTWAEFLTAAGATLSAGDIVYVVAAGGAINLSSTDAPSGRSGTEASPITLAGCYAAAGDLDAVAYNADGSLVTTNWPVITYSGTGRLSLGGSYWIVRNLVIKSNVSNNTLTLAGNSVVMACRLENASTGGSTGCVEVGTIGDAINCDLLATGASGGYCAVSVAGGTISGCRILQTQARGIAVYASGSVIVGCTIIGGTVGIDFTSVTVGAEPPACFGNTIVGCSVAGIRVGNATYQRLMQVVNCVITGCAVGILSLRDATSQVPLLAIGNYLRNTVNVDGFDGWYAGTVGGASNTIGTGTDASDFVNAGTKDYRLRRNVPGVTAAIGRIAAGARGAIGGGIAVVARRLRRIR